MVGSLAFNWNSFYPKEYITLLISAVGWVELVPSQQPTYEKRNSWDAAMIAAAIGPEAMYDDPYHSRPLWVNGGTGVPPYRFTGHPRRGAAGRIRR